MKTITTSRNKTYPVTWAQVITRRNAPAQLVIELTQEQEAAQYAIKASSWWTMRSPART